MTTLDNEVFLLDNFASLGAALGSVGAQPLFDAAHGCLWLRGALNPNYDLGYGADAAALCFDTNSSYVLDVPTDGEFNAIGWGVFEGNQMISLAAGAKAALINFNLEAESTSAPTSDLYGVIGGLWNHGPGTAKALYGRANATSSCTGVVMGGVLGVDTVPGLQHATGLQMTHDTYTNGGVVNESIWVSSNVVGEHVKINYGLLLDGTVEIQAGGAALQAAALGPGNFLTFQTADQTKDLFTVDSGGNVNLAYGAIMRLNASALTATAGTLPSPGDFAGFAVFEMNGQQIKVPYYN